jgi:ABC-type glutathione transport system ATPase component
MTPLLEVAGLTVRLPVSGESRTVLEEISFSIEPGEALALVGESGSGKSMTARSIVRLLPQGAVVEGVATAAMCTPFVAGACGRRGTRFRWCTRIPGRIPSRCGALATS